MRSIFFAVAALIVVAASATASDFDTCVLQHMQGVRSDVAAVSVKQSCLRIAEVPLPHDALQTLATDRAMYGKLPSYVGGTGLYITLNNNSGYTITELTIKIKDKKTHATERYIIRSFPFVPSPGVNAMDPPKDLSLIQMIGPGQRQFYTQINETTRDPMKWGDAYVWSLISAKGFRD